MHQQGLRSSAGAELHPERAARMVHRKVLHPEALALDELADDGVDHHLLPDHAAGRRAADGLRRRACQPPLSDSPDFT